MKDDVLRRAEGKRLRALGILGELDLLGLWKQFGEPVVVGAVRYGLVAARDIDMEIYAESPRVCEGFEVMAHAAAHPGVRQVLFLNELEGPDQGLYWQIQFRDALGEPWKIDSWFVAHSHPDAHWCERFGEAMTRTLTEQNRKTILEIKEAACEAQAGLRGIDVYRAVLEGRAATLDQCRRWLQEHPAEGMCHWLPEADAAELKS
jgi:hypothetical protein